MNGNVTVTVNNERRSVTTDTERSLLDVLREEWGLTGSKYGCGEGACGACTVLIDGVAERSCITPIAEAREKTVTTIEGLANGEQLHPMQQAFVDEESMQCGYCTAGMILTAVSLLDRLPNPTREQIAAEMNDNLCRCCGYPKIVEAIHRAAQTQAEVSKR